METAMVVGGCWPAIETALVVLLANNGNSHGLRWVLSSNGGMGVCGPAMETWVHVGWVLSSNGGMGVCWPAMETWVCGWWVLSKPIALKSFRFLCVQTRFL